MNVSMQRQTFDARTRIIVIDTNFYEHILNEGGAVLYFSSETIFYLGE